MRIRIEGACALSLMVAEVAFVMFGVATVSNALPCSVAVCARGWSYTSLGPDHGRCDHSSGFPFYTRAHRIVHAQDCQSPREFDAALGTCKLSCGCDGTRACPRLLQWGAWSYLDGPTAHHLIQPAVAMDRDDKLRVFAIAGDQAVWTVGQRGEDPAHWSAWESLFRTIATTSAAPRRLLAASNQDRRLELLLLQGRQVLHNYETSPTSPGWSGWTPLTTWVTADDIAVGRNTDDRLEVFGVEVTRNNAVANVWHMWQNRPNGGWSQPARLPLSDELRAPGATRPLLVTSKERDGRLVLVAVAADGTLHAIRQSTAGGDWENWIPLANGVDGTATLVAGTNQDGRVEVFGRKSNGTVWHTFQDAPGIWRSGSVGPINDDRQRLQGSGSLALGKNFDGRLELFLIGPNGEVLHAFQHTPNSEWSDWSPLQGFAGHWQGTSDPQAIALATEAYERQGFLNVFATFVPRSSGTRGRPKLWRAYQNDADLTQSADPDGDMLSNGDEQTLGTDPLSADSDRDGISDGREIRAGAGQTDLRAFGADPLRADFIVLVARQVTVPNNDLEHQLTEAVRFFGALAVPNPNNVTGIHFAWLTDMNNSAGGPGIPELALPCSENENIANFRRTIVDHPHVLAAWRGAAHFVESYNAGGGNSPSPSIISSAGIQNGWSAGLVHELGHQLGLEHKGYQSTDQPSPYQSLMNYAYDQPVCLGGLNHHAACTNDSVCPGGTCLIPQFSDGVLAGLLFDENALYERVPVPPATLRFLTNHPFNFSVRADTVQGVSLVDWNRDNQTTGPIAGDITSYYDDGLHASPDEPREWRVIPDGSSTPQRPLVNARTAPSFFTLPSGQLGLAYVVGQSATLDSTHGGTVRLTRLVDPPPALNRSDRRTSLRSVGTNWDRTQSWMSQRALGEPVSAIFNGRLYVALQGLSAHFTPRLIMGAFDASTLVLLSDSDSPTDPVINVPSALAQSGGQPSLVVADDRLFVFVRGLSTGPDTLTYTSIGPDGVYAQLRTLPVTSTRPVGLVYDSTNPAIVVVRTQTLNAPDRLIVTRFAVRPDHSLAPTPTEEVVGGGGGAVAAGSRPAALFFQPPGAVGPNLYVAYQGNSANGLRDFLYMSIRFLAGWREYTVPLHAISAPSLTVFADDITGGALIDEDSSPNLRVAHNWTGIRDRMADHDDLSHVRDEGLWTSMATWDAWVEESQRDAHRKTCVPL